MFPVWVICVDSSSDVGQTQGPVRDIYFKVLKKGSCSVAGAVLGFPTLDFDSEIPGEGLGWRNHPHGAEFVSLNVTLPRLDDERKKSYFESLARVTASSLVLNFISCITGPKISSVGSSGLRQTTTAR